MAKLVHLTILIKKLDTQTNEEFHKYWQFEHPKAWLSVKIVQEKVIKYSHFHVDNATTEHPKAAGIPMAEYDGGLNIWGKSVDDLMAVFQNEEYLPVVVPDEEKFVKRLEGQMLIGRDEDLWVDGKGVIRDEA